MEGDNVHKIEFHVHDYAQVNVAEGNGIVNAIQNNGIGKPKEKTQEYDINGVIQYKWTFGWTSENMSEPAPIVNRLLKAIIEGDIHQMDELYKQGAALSKMHRATFERALFHIIGEYDTISWLIRHGMTAESTRDCIGIDGYIWGLLARAWYVRAYDVMELLAYFGFDWTVFCINGNGYNAVEEIFKKDDIRAMRILKEHGFIEEYGYAHSVYRLKYPNSKVTFYLEEYPVIKRKSVGLDNFKFRTIPKPELEKKGLFNRKKVQERNEIRIADYNDRLRAQKEYLKVFPNKA